MYLKWSIAKRGENLDICWLRDESLQSADDLPDPDEIAAEIRMRLQTAIEEMEALTEYQKLVSLLDDLIDFYPKSQIELTKQFWILDFGLKSSMGICAAQI